jgi:hypothetical protein
VAVVGVEAAVVAGVCKNLLAVVADVVFLVAVAVSLVHYSIQVFKVSSVELGFSTSGYKCQ